jgi:hypothetical protein
MRLTVMLFQLLVKCKPLEKVNGRIGPLSEAERLKVFMHVLVKGSGSRFSSFL